MEHQSPTFVDANGFAIATRSLLLEVTANSDSELDFTGLDDSFPRYVIEGDNVRADTDNVQLNALFSIGGSFKSGASDYGWVANAFSSDGTDGRSFDATDAKISTNRTSANDMWGVSAGQRGDITFTITRGGSSNHPRLWSTTVFYSDGSDFVRTEGFGAYTGLTSDPADDLHKIDGVRLFFSAGAIESGIFRLYGVE
jgi:hypothetical protein